MFALSLSPSSGSKEKAFWLENRDKLASPDLNAKALCCERTDRVGTLAHSGSLVLLAGSEAGAFTSMSGEGGVSETES